MYCPDTEKGYSDARSWPLKTTTSKPTSVKSIVSLLAELKNHIRFSHDQHERFKIVLSVNRSLCSSKFFTTVWWVSPLALVFEWKLLPNVRAGAVVRVPKAAFFQRIISFVFLLVNFFLFTQKLVYFYRITFFFFEMFLNQWWKIFTGLQVVDICKCAFGNQWRLPKINK